MIRPAFCISLCISLLFLPIHLIVVWCTAAAIHELGHIFAMRLMKIRILRMTIDFGGTKIVSGYMHPTAEWVCAIAGPCLGLMCLCFAKTAPLLAICAFVQNAYNLLPFQNHDGERVLRIVLSMLLPHKAAEGVIKGICSGVALSLFAIGIYLWRIQDLGFSVFLLFVFPLLKLGCQKYLANRRN